MTLSITIKSDTLLIIQSVVMLAAIMLIVIAPIFLLDLNVSTHFRNNSSEDLTLRCVYTSDFAVHFCTNLGAFTRAIPPYIFATEIAPAFDFAFKENLANFLVNLARKFFCKN
jgi:hypothetical protein